MEEIYEAIIQPLQYMAATPLEKVYQGTFLCSVSVSSFSSFSSAHQAALATIRVAEAWRREMYSGRVEGNYKRNQFNEFPPCMKKCL